MADNYNHVYDHQAFDLFFTSKVLKKTYLKTNTNLN